MRHGSLFSGIGGFDLAAEWMGWENVFQVEKDSFCQKVLEKNFPNTKRYGDIKEFDGTKYRGAVDVLSGGFPCQSFSLAGKGAVDLSLWKEMFRVVGEVRPKVVVAENVYGILARKKGVALSTVYNDLENEGYTTMPPLIIPACGTGAWHQRDRVWIVAYSDSFRRVQYKQTSSAVQNKQWDVEIQAGRWQTVENGITSSPKIITNPESQRRITGMVRSGNESKVAEPHYYFRASDWNPWSTEPLVGGRVHGIPNRVDRVKALGNAIVPQVAYEIFKAINQVTNERNTH